MSDKEEVDLDKLKSVGVNIGGKGPRTEVIDRRGSTITKHWDGRQDAHIMAPSVGASITVNKPESEEQ